MNINGEKYHQWRIKVSDFKGLFFLFSLVFSLHKIKFSYFSLNLIWIILIDDFYAFLFNFIPLLGYQFSSIWFLNSDLFFNFSFFSFIYLSFTLRFKIFHLFISRATAQVQIRPATMYYQLIRAVSELFRPWTKLKWQDNLINIFQLITMKK